MQPGQILVNFHCECAKVLPDPDADDGKPAYQHVYTHVIITMAGLCSSNLHVETPIPSMRFEMEMLTARCENYPAYYEVPILISRSSEGANSRQSSGIGKNVRAIRRPAFLPQRRRPCLVRVPNGEGVPVLPLAWRSKVHSEGKSIFENIPKFNFIDENLERVPSDSLNRNAGFSQREPAAGSCPVIFASPTGSLLFSYTAYPANKR
ncbi:uncharacterized protein CIMG_12877 [Coccidioides immitis RS]|uniref:Uncharacterized protein n=1 Tax=Coccidioides immitis (strain RS) TaxID=246410 RepID=A0A0D8JTN2_COCIM|nr:uncharacterized protein CIMG_12877 [Coccidioides immitis RS]KJF60326.1 hypothetical protein CIMG_12877 [Coccidioides immitis RS]